MRSGLMNNPTRYPRILGIRRRVAGAALVLAIMLVPAVLATGSAQAQTYAESVLHTFTGPPDGASPTGLALDAQGNLYGIAGGGDSACDPPYGCGTVFKVDASGNETVLHSFTGTGGDGADPFVGLTLDAQGNLYGTTWFGGDLACNGGDGCGTVFMLDTAGVMTVLYTFTGTGGDGALPGGLVRDAQGNLYGTTSDGGDLACNAPNGCGTAFELDTLGKETALYSFTGTGGDGAVPGAGLVRDA